MNFYLKKDSWKNYYRRKNVYTYIDYIDKKIIKIVN